MGSRVFVGNLSFDTEDAGLFEYMSQCGEVVKATVMVNPTGRSKGCAIVEFASREGATDAIDQLSDTTLDGRKIFVREDRETRGFNGRRPVGGDRPHAKPRAQVDVGSGKQLWVGNLPWSVSSLDLKDLFSEYGEVLNAEIASDRNGRSKGFGTVLFADPDKATEAVDKLNETEFCGRNIIVREDNYAKK